MLFMLFIMRAGLQILADHPRLYWGRDCTPGTDWFRFQVPVPKERIWTAKDDSVTLPAWLGIPGLRHTLGLSRWWHFSINLLWLINGVAFLRAAVRDRSMAQAGAADLGGVSRRALDRDPICVAELSGRPQLDALQWPAAAQLLRHRVRRRAGLDRHRPDAEPGDLQRAGLVRPGLQPAGDAVGPLHLVRLVRGLHPGARRHGVRHGHQTEHQPHVRRRRRRLLDGLSAIPARDGDPRLRLGWWPRPSRSGTPGWCSAPARSWSAGSWGWPNAGIRGPQLTEKDISPYFWPNGTMPNSKEFDELAAEDFADYRLRISGLVEAPRNFLVGRSQGDAEAGADHDAFLHPGMVGRRRMGRRSHARHPRSGASRPPRPATPCSTHWPMAPTAAATTTSTRSRTCAMS